MCTEGLWRCSTADQALFALSRVNYYAFCCEHRRNQDFVWGCTFLPKKIDDLFLVVTLKNHLNIPPNLSHPAKTVLKISKNWLALAGGALRVLGGCSYTFSCKLGLKIFFFHRPGGACTHCTPGYAYGCESYVKKNLINDPSKARAVIWYIFILFYRISSMQFYSAFFLTSFYLTAVYFSNYTGWAKKTGPF